MSRGMHVQLLSVGSDKIVQKVGEISWYSGLTCLTQALVVRI